jgi:exopolysaccharide biosynthesis WecB/TagA/CpsF family protein
LLWRLLKRGKVERISGLKYLKHLLRKLKDEKTAKVCFVLSTERAKQKLVDWSRREDFPLGIDNCYIAPWYGLDIEDRNFLELVERYRPGHVIIAIGGGAQEKLGYYLRENLSFRPAIHCTGAALGFITGDQIAIPDWADRFYLGWFLRLTAQPRRFVPRLIHGLELPWLISRYGDALPPLRPKRAPLTA